MLQEYFILMRKIHSPGCCQTRQSDMVISKFPSCSASTMPLIRSSQAHTLLLHAACHPCFSRHIVIEKKQEKSVSSTHPPAGDSVKTMARAFTGIFHHAMSALSCNHGIGAWYNLYVCMLTSVACPFSRCLYAARHHTTPLCG